MAFKYLFVLVFMLISSAAFAINMCGPHFGDGLTLPKEVIEKFPTLAASQPHAVQLLGYQVLLHNQKLFPYLKNLAENQDRKSLSAIVQVLHQHQTFEFPLTQEGYLPAANNGGHHGGYGSYVWYRDLARAMTGVSALPRLLKMSGVHDAKATQDVSKLAAAKLHLFAEREQIIRTLQNIFDPEFHKDPNNGFRNVPFIRLGLQGRTNGKKLTAEDIKRESDWGHKQNDALALYAHAIIDAVAKGDLNAKDISSDALSEMVYLAGYFQKVKFASMEDVGAWEEGMGLRTSSVGLVTSFLERFYDGISQPSDNRKRDDPYFRRLKQALFGREVFNSLSNTIKNNPAELKGIDPEIGVNTLKGSLVDIPRAIKDSYKILYKRLGITIKEDGTRVYSEIKELEDRGADAAILHMLLYPPKELTLRDREHVLTEIKKKLMKDSGFIRYKEDWFLYGNPNAVESAGHLPIPPDMIAVIGENGQPRPSTRTDRDQVYAEYQAQKYKKDMAKIIAQNGPELEAEWSFQDSIVAQIYIQFYKESGDQNHLNAAGYHLSRAMAFVTGDNQMSIEGGKITAWRTPEAEVPVQFIHNGQVFKVYLTSPNSPLIWASGELVKALYDYMTVLR